MAQSNWEADKMLNVYIHDYLLKRKLHNSAKAFMTEGKVATDPVAIDAPGGFLFEWWSVFWDIFIARTNEKHSEAAAAYIETQHMKAREHQQQQQLQMQQLQLMQQRNAQLQRRNPNHSPLGGPVTAINSEGMMGQPSASVLAMKMYEEQMKHPQPMDLETSSALIDPNRMALLKSSHQGQLVQGNLGNMLQQIQGRPQLATDIKGEVNLGGTQKSLPMDPSSIYGQAILQSKAGLGAGLNQGVTGLPLKGWPLTGIDEVRPSLGLQVQKPNLQTQNQFLLASQQQQVLAQAQGNLGNSPNYGFGGLPRGNFNVKDGQLPRNDGSICSPVQSNLPKMKLSQMQHSSSQQHDQLQQQQQQQQQTNRKRKQHSSSGHANSTGTSNTVGPSPSSPASTHTPGDGMTSMSKGLMMYGGEGTGGIASSTNQLDDLEPFGDIGSLEDNVESFLSHDGGDGNIYARLKQTLNEHKPESSKGFSFGEVGCIRTRNKVTCCHFSSDGKLLASAGHDKKAVLWNMDTLQTETTPEEHQYLITDIRFRPNSSQLATASFDKSVRLWDSTNPSYCLHAYTGHTSHVMSLDFHPKKNDLFCFCDSNNEIRYWSITPFSCTRVSKQGGSAQVRFQPLSGRLLAAASDKVVSVFDVENDRKIHSFQGHPGVVNYLCWDLNVSGAVGHG
ncbi:transcriptional corepressor LEUNIG_HOMOLOG isoform X8 [Capsicum annuum]|uniref:transcriptional corepressor LEUNIG_HOMOLOG isoform X8 n=1 Tax=Capsicum annuum TaxID=4072 RepID=UPI001FB05519|nr:transcriptional corepressor LEUNIG_HOMOLOG isoform X8 [Capsicum annuum]